MREKSINRIRSKSKVLYLSIFLVTFLGLITIFCSTNGIITSALDTVVGRNQENYIVDLDEVSNCGFERNGDLWIKNTASTAYIDVNIMSYISRLTVFFSEPVPKDFQIYIDYLKSDMMERNPLTSQTIQVRKGDEFAEIPLQGNVTLLRVNFVAERYMQFRLDSLVVNSNTPHLAKKFASLPWLWIFCMSGALAFLVYLTVDKAIYKRTFAATVCVVFVMALMLYRGFLCGDVSYLYTTTDGFSQYLPTYESYARNLREKGYLPWWSFSIGFGSPLSYDVLLYPLNAIPFLSGVLLGSHALEMSFSWMQVIKIILAAVCMYIFLKEIGLSALPCSLVSVLYAFCGIIVLRGNWGFLADECYIVMFLLWSVERYFRKGQWYYIPLGILLLAVCLGLYYLYLYAVLLFIYTTIRFIISGQPFRKYFQFIFKCGGLYLLGVLGWSIVLIGFGWLNFATERFSDTKDYFALSDIFNVAGSDVLLSALLRTFSTDSLGVYESYSGSLNLLEGPLFYCGLSCLFLVPQAFIFANRRLKCLIAFGCMAAAAYMMFPIVTDVLNAFIRNEELKFRSYRLSSLWICILLLVVSAYGLECGLKKGKFDEKTVLISGTILCALFIFATQVAVKYNFKTNHIIGFGVMLFIFAWLIFLSYYKKTHGATAALFLIAVVEAFIFSSATIGSSFKTAQQNYAQMQLDDTGYYSSIPNALSYIRHQDEGLFRIGGANVKTGVAKYSAPLYFGLFSSSYYTNIDGSTYRFLKEVYPESFDNNIGIKFSVGVERSLCLSTITGYKYFIAPAGSSENAIPFGYRHLKRAGNMDVYLNSYALPFGFAYDSCMLESEFMQLNADERQAVLLACAVLKDDDATSLPIISSNKLNKLLGSVSLSGASGESYVDASEMDWYKTLASNRELLNVTSWREDQIKGWIKVPNIRLLFLPIPNVKGWTLWIDGEETEIIGVNLGFMGAVLSEGTHQIELRYRSKMLSAGAMLSLAAIILYTIMILFRKKLSWLRPNVNIMSMNSAELGMPNGTTQEEMLGKDERHIEGGFQIEEETGRNRCN